MKSETTSAFSTLALASTYWTSDDPALAGLIIGGGNIRHIVEKDECEAVIFVH
jgi:hypothetical protein